MTPLDPALLAAILASPNDDAIRLIASDWWEEHGEEKRAEFVRVQVQRASGERCWCETNLPEGSHGSCPRDTLRRRERVLLATEAVLWAAERPYCGSQDNGTVWRRGFVDAIRCPAQHWLDHAAAILATQPVRKVTLTTWPSMDWMFRNVQLIPMSESPLGMPIREWLLYHVWPGIHFAVPGMPSTPIQNSPAGVTIDHYSL